VGGKTGAYRRGGWRDTDVWLDPDELEWFGELARTVRAAVSAQPLLAGVDGGAVALPGLGLRPLPAAGPALPRSRRPGPSRGRRLATRLLPTVAALAATPVGVTLLLASRAADPVVAPPAPEPRSVQAPTRLPDTRPPVAAEPVATAEPAAANVSLQEPAYPAIRWRSSQAIGVPHNGRLVDGVRLPVTGPDWVTWDPVLHRVPNRANRVYGTDALVRLVLGVIGEYRLAHPEAPRVVVGDLSHRYGGEIDEHVSHENGLDVDVYYPRLDGRLRPPNRAGQVDVRLAQDLVDRFVAAGVRVVFVGYSTRLRGPGGVVVPYPGHDNHMHVRISASAAG
jgi:hypothetical protein